MATNLNEPVCRLRVSIIVFLEAKVINVVSQPNNLESSKPLFDTIKGIAIPAHTALHTALIPTTNAETAFSSNHILSTYICGAC